MASALKSTATADILCRLLSMCYELFLLIATLAIALVFPHVLLGAFAHRVATTPVLWAHLFFVLLIYCLGFWIDLRRTDPSHENLAYSLGNLRQTPGSSGAGAATLSAVLAKHSSLRYRPALGAR